jgi:hypothetical protein
MAIIALVTDPYFQNNRIFDEKDSIVNRDDCQRQWIELRKMAAQRGHTLATCDLNAGVADVFLFENIPDPTSEYFRVAQRSKKPLIVIINENIHIHKWNALKTLHDCFDIIFTYQDDLIDGKRYRKLNYSFLIPEKIDGTFDRPIFCSIIAGNKRLNHRNELYSERLRAIKWFEKNNPNDLQLYGRGWNRPPIRLGTSGRIMRAWHRLKERIFSNDEPPSIYKGEVVSKREVLNQSKFSICYENASDLPGYITEKIFDVIFAGCVPIYLGAPNVTQHIPATVFIDKRNYRNYSDLYRHLKSWRAENYAQWLKDVNHYIKSEQIKEYSVGHFVEQILSAIDQILKGQSAR